MIFETEKRNARAEIKRGEIAGSGEVIFN